jgi:hypothetical protein
LRWERDDGSVFCQLVTGKTQVAPQVKITILRMELVAAVNSFRLARKVRETLKIPLAGTHYFTDSSAVSGMLRTELGKFTEFCGSQSERGQGEQQRGGRMAMALWGTVILRTSGHGRPPPLRTWPLGQNIRKGWHG